MIDPQRSDSDSAEQRLWRLYKERGDAQHPDILAMLETVSDRVRSEFQSDVELNEHYSRLRHQLAPGDQVGSVQIVRILRQGGTATVYQGIQSFQTGASQATRDVAFKVISPFSQPRLQVVPGP